MPYNSTSGEYERRSSTVIDATPDGDTVAVAIDDKLDLASDDAVLDLNHHAENGNHYPATSAADNSRYLRQSPAGVVAWANGVPIGDAVESALLADTGGADLVGYGEGSVQDALDAHTSDISARPTSAAISASGGAALVGFLQAGTGAPARTVQAKLRDVVSVKDFGAVGDGVTDDTVAIKAAIAHIASFGTTAKPELHFPSGVYRITEKLTFAQRYVRICGAGIGRALGSASNITGGTAILYDGPELSATEGVLHLPTAVSTRGFQVYDLSLLCQFKGNGIFMERSDMSEIRRVYIEQAVIAILHYDVNYSATIERCEIFDPSVGGIKLRSNSHACRIDKCRFVNNYADGSVINNPLYAIEIAGAANCSNVGINGCTFDFYNVTRHVYHVTESKGFNFVGNYIECRGDGVTANCLVINGAAGSLIAGNRFSKSDTPTTTPIDYAVSIGGTVDGCAVIGNWFNYAWNTACIRVGSTAKNVFTSGNYVDGITELVDQSTDKSVTTVQGGNVKSSKATVSRLAFGAPAAHVIASDAITIGDSSFITVDTESSAATDNLATINGATENGQILVVRSFINTRDIVVKDGTGNLALAGDCTLGVANDRLTLLWDSDLDRWVELSRSVNG